MSSPVDLVCTDDAAEFMGGTFADLCWERDIRHEFTTANSPQFNGIAERGIVLTKSAGKATVIQAGVMFPSMGIPSGDSL